MEIIDWKKYVMKNGRDSSTLVHCPTCGIQVVWDTSWDENKLIFYCAECGHYSHNGRAISDEEAIRLSEAGG